MAEEAAGSDRELTRLGFGTVPDMCQTAPSTGAGRCSPTSHSEKGPPASRPPRTRVVAGDTGGTAEHLPEQGGILLPILDEDILQCLRPVQLIEDDGGCERQSPGWAGGCGGAAELL